MVIIENEYLQAKIKPFGAELVSVIDKKTGYEFMWQADKQFWGKCAPVLFPIVGGLKDGQYTHNGQTYHLPRHGFARDMVFENQVTNEDSATFYLRSNPDTRQVYPFDFSFQITYILHENKMSVSYELWNASPTETMYYNVGGHPAFNVTNNADNEFANVTFMLEPKGAYLHIPFTKAGFTNFKKEKFIPLNYDELKHNDFKKDAILYRVNDNVEAVLHDPTQKVTIRLRPTQMPYFALWSPYPAKAPFVCLEPWAGIPDVEETTGELSQKRDVIALAPRQVSSHAYTMTFIKE